jgi:monoterpene epsilon-lactone hydrolase
MTTRAAHDPLVQREAALSMAAAYLAGQDPRTPLASPIYADLRGLPPLLIQVGTAETLLDDARRLADRARAVGVTVDLEVWDHMIHV